MVGELDPDADLMRRVKRGDRQAFTALVEKYQQPILNLTYRMIGDLAEAEDLAQSTFLQLHRSACRYREDARFSTWLFTIARNLCLNELRRRSRHPAESLDLPHPTDESQPLRSLEDHRSVSPPDALLRRELEQKVQGALDALPPNQRLALLLCRQDDLSYEDISRVLRCSLSATKSLIHRARETVKQRLKAYLQSGAWDEEGNA